MEITVGVQFATRELVVQTKTSTEEVQKLIEHAFGEGQKLLWLTDETGKHVAIPTDKIAYVEVGSDRDHKSVGFAP